MGKECKALVVLPVPVDRVTMKQRWRIDEKCRRPVRFTVKCLRLVNPATPADVQVLDCCLPKIFSLRLPVTRSDQKRIDSDPFKWFWQSPSDIPQTAGF